MLRRVSQTGLVRMSCRTYCNKKQSTEIKKSEEEELSKEEVLRMANKARADSELWKIAAPERQLTIMHPATWVMLAIILYMQVNMYYKYGGTLPDDAELYKEEKKKGWDE